MASHNPAYGPQKCGPEGSIAPASFVGILPGDVIEEAAEATDARAEHLVEGIETARLRIVVACVFRLLV